MCDPVSAATAGISAGSQLLGFGAARRAASEQNRAWSRNREAAIDSSKHESAAAVRNFFGIAADTSRRISEVRREQSEILAETALSASEGGIGGSNTAAVLMMDAARRAEESVLAYRDALDAERHNLAAEQRSVSARATDRTNSVQRARPPSVMQLGLGLAAAGVSAFSSADARSFSRTGSGLGIKSIIEG